MKVLLVINDAPYGSEKAYNALRLGMAMQAADSNVEVRIFLMADAVTSALPNQTTPTGYYNIERMLKAIINRGGQVKACGTCSEGRGIEGLRLIEGVEISTMSQLKDWVIESDRVLSF
jgi:uncharacterized protein involved in oxidation of intracellular sulfur